MAVSALCTYGDNLMIMAWSAPLPPHKMLKLEEGPGVQCRTRRSIHGSPDDQVNSRHSRVSSCRLLLRCMLGIDGGAEGSDPSLMFQWREREVQAQGHEPCGKARRPIWRWSMSSAFTPRSLVDD